MYKTNSLIAIIIAFIILVIAVLSYEIPAEITEDSRTAYRVVLFSPIAIAIFGWITTFQNHSPDSSGFRRYIAGTFIMISGAFFYVSIIALIINSEYLLAISCLIIPILQVWLWFQWGKVKQEFEQPKKKTSDLDDDETEEDDKDIFGEPESDFKPEIAPDDISETITTEQLDGKITIKGRGKQASDAVSMETGRYKLIFHLYRYYDDDSVSINTVNVDDVNADEESILFEYAHSGSNTFAIKENGRYVFSIDGDSSEGKVPAWEVDITKL
jgi:hypothetical protein